MGELGMAWNQYSESVLYAPDLPRGFLHPQCCYTNLFCDVTFMLHAHNTGLTTLFQHDRDCKAVERSPVLSLPQQKQTGTPVSFTVFGTAVIVLRVAVTTVCGGAKPWGLWGGIDMSIRWIAPGRRISSNLDES